jgi:hypothetical protein
MTTFMIGLAHNFSPSLAMFISPFRGPRFCAFSALAVKTVSSRLDVKIGILSRIKVPSWTVGASRPKQSGSARILPRRDKIQMQWINAIPLAAKMVDLLTGGNWTYKKGVDKSVSVPFASIPPNFTIARDALGSYPVPAPLFRFDRNFASYTNRQFCKIHGYILQNLH